MKKQCMYCGRIYGNKLKLPPGLPPGTVSHGICRACGPRANAEVDAAIKKLKENKL